MEYAVIIERDPESDSVDAYSPDVAVYVVRDASFTDDEMIAEFKSTLETYVESMRQDGLPLPERRHTVAMVSA